MNTSDFRLSSPRVQAALHVDLFAWAVANLFPQDYQAAPSGDVLRLREVMDGASEDYLALYFKQGCDKFWDSRSGRFGSPIEFAMSYFGADIGSAVSLLTEGNPDGPAFNPVPARQRFPISSSARPFMDWPSEPPVPSIGRCRRGPDLPPASGSADRIVSYLTRDCRIPLELVQALIRDKILYQSDAGDAVFTAPDGKYAEVLNCADTRNAIVHGSKPDKFWWFKACGMDAKPVAVYMCGSALDAVSLYAIHQIEHPRLLELQKAAKDPALNLKISRREAALYVSLGTREAAAAVLEGMFMSHSMYAAFGGSPEGRALARFCCEQEAYRKANELIPAHGSWHEALIAGASAWLAGDFNSIPLPRED